ncbi:hypothetical protein [Streptomyces sp. RerS4]|uniref:hypothetical protein n=1 Tax=Streptomyces sp. RerS4 TaxID=2942449 RepID=UPI00201C6B1E|nr:hypothetical protein [Streptomyces sp. RerS4]UQW99255.1 hypothetical protein M4D82_00895 [Streptomyces sp. RerS4]
MIGSGSDFVDGGAAMAGAVPVPYFASCVAIFLALSGIARSTSFGGRVCFAAWATIRCAALMAA